MLDINFIREHSDIVKAGAKKKNIDVDIDALLKIDDERRALQQKVDERRAEQNKIAELIPTLEGEERNAKITESKSLKEELQADEAKLKDVLVQWRALMVQVPNVPDVSVPEGNDDADIA